MPKAKPCRDHLGNKYKSAYQMYNHYGLDSNTYYNRLSLGWSLEKILTTKPRRGSAANPEIGLIKKNGCYFDHLGNPYVSTKSMSKCWHIGTNTFYRRLEEGHNLEYILTHKNKTTQPDKDNKVIWVFGVSYGKYSDVDIAFGFRAKQAHAHRDDLEGWLTTAGRFYVDDKVFPSLSELAEAYNLTGACLYNRIFNLGWSIEDAVHKPPQHSGRCIPCEDHLGNSYPSKRDMAAAYHITYSVYMDRIKYGWSVKDALTTPARRHARLVTAV